MDPATEKQPPSTKQNTESEPTPPSRPSKAKHAEPHDPHQQLNANHQAAPKTWLITGVAGFIGSNLLETLLKLDQRVVGLDNAASSSISDAD